MLLKQLECEGGERQLAGVPAREPTAAFGQKQAADDGGDTGQGHEFHSGCPDQTAKARIGSGGEAVGHGFASNARAETVMASTPVVTEGSASILNRAEWWPAAVATSAAGVPPTSK